MIKNIKIAIIHYLIFIGIASVVDLLWKIFELIEYGHTKPSISDTIIGIGFAYSLYKNLNIKVGGGQDAE